MGYLANYTLHMSMLSTFRYKIRCFTAEAMSVTFTKELTDRMVNTCATSHLLREEAIDESQRYNMHRKRNHAYYWLHYLTYCSYISCIESKNEGKRQWGFVPFFVISFSTFYLILSWPIAWLELTTSVIKERPALLSVYDLETVVYLCYVIFQ